MWGLAAVIIPIACCMLIPVVIAVAAYIRLGKKKPNDNGSDGEPPQELLSQASQLKQDK